MYITYTFGRQLRTQARKQRLQQLVMPRPHQQQCRSNIVQCYKFNDSFDRCFYTVAVFWQQCRTKFHFSTKSKQIEHVQFVSILSKGRHFTKNSFKIVAKNGNNIETTFHFVEGTKYYDKLVQHSCRFLVTKSNVASTLLLVWTGLKTTTKYAELES